MKEKDMKMYLEVRKRMKKKDLRQGEHERKLKDRG